MIKQFYLNFYGALKGSTTQGYNGPGSNGNEEVHLIPQRSWIGVSQLDAV